VFPGFGYLHSSLIFPGKEGAYQNGALTKLFSYGKLTALLENNRLGWKWLIMTYTLAFYDMAIMTVLKSFITTDPSVS
jgi:hypothetical protein